MPREHVLGIEFIAETDGHALGEKGEAHLWPKAANYYDGP
jgi:hypothetical protein